MKIAEIRELSTAEVEQFAEELSSVPGVRRVGAIRKAEK